MSTNQAIEYERVALVAVHWDCQMRNDGQPVVVPPPPVAPTLVTSSSCADDDESGSERACVKPLLNEVQNCQLAPPMLNIGVRLYQASRITQAAYCAPVWHILDMPATTTANVHVRVG